MTSISVFRLWSVMLLSMTQQCFCQTEFRFANIYGNDMVLQQSPDRSQVWGYSTTANDVITAQLIVSSTNSVVETVTYTTDTNLIWIDHYKQHAIYC